MLSLRWVENFMGLARQVATWSKDSTKVGCVITEGNEVKAMGYNGPPSTFVDEEVLALPDKNLFIVHAEDNALLRCGLTHNGHMFITKPPCMACATKIVNAKYEGVNICHLYCPIVLQYPLSKWFQSQVSALKYLENNGVQVHFVAV